MRPFRSLFATVAIALLSWSSAIVDAAAAQDDCGEMVPCTLQDGTNQYYVAPPPRWDGQRRLPVFVFIHGYGATGEGMMGWTGVRRVAERGGYLFVAPDGLNKTWAHQGSPSNRRNEMAYFRAVLSDVAERFPIDRNHVVISGFSQGGSMAWDLACQMGNRARAFIPIAGGFWNPMPTSCPGAPVNLLHIHGTQDRTVPLKGRPIGQSWHQGDIVEGFKVWTAAARCGTPRQTRRGKFTCTVWDQCESGNRLELCLHDSGHSVPGGWGQEARRFLRSLN